MPEYRKCAGVIVFNRDKKVLACARIGNRGNQWQFPQGGIMRKEDAATAAVRELYEETSIKSVKVIQTLTEPLRYVFPGAVRRRMKRRSIDSLGQDVYWSLLYFYGDDSEINVRTKQPEFKSWKWIDIEEAPERIVYFKKDVYYEAVAQLKPAMEAFSVQQLA